AGGAPTPSDPSPPVPTLDEEDRMASHSTLTRRALLGVGGAAALAGTVAAWPRLTGADIPGRGEDALRILILGTSQDAAGRQKIADAFMETHPDIPVLIQSVQATDWGELGRASCREGVMI